MSTIFDRSSIGMNINRLKILLGHLNIFYNTQLFDIGVIEVAMVFY